MSFSTAYDDPRRESIPAFLSRRGSGVHSFEPCQLRSVRIIPPDARYELALILCL